MSNAVFPTFRGIKLSTRKSPIWSTTVQRAFSGRSKRVSNWTYPIWEIELQFEFLRDTATHNELKQLLGFFCARRGRGDHFLFDDPDDHYISDQQLGVGDGSQTDFQLIRSIDTWVEPCKNIKSSPAPKIYLDGVLQESGYSITMMDSGMVSFTAPPAEGVVVSADFGYYFRVCFKDDQADFQKTFYQVWELGRLELESIK